MDVCMYLHVKRLVVNRSRRRRCPKQQQQKRRCVRVAQCVCVSESVSKILFVFCVSVILTRVLNVRAALRAAIQPLS